MSLILTIEDEVYLKRDVFLISAHVKDYRMAWGINQVTNLELSKSEDLVQKVKSQELRYAIFRHYSESDKVDFKLIPNRGNPGQFLKKFKQFDFLLVMETEEESTEFPDYLAPIKSLKFVNSIMMAPTGIAQLPIFEIE